MFSYLVEMMSCDVRRLKTSKRARNGQHFIHYLFWPNFCMYKYGSHLTPTHLAHHRHMLIVTDTASLARSFLAIFLFVLIFFLWGERGIVFFSSGNFAKILRMINKQRAPQLGRVLWKIEKTRFDCLSRLFV